jgi:hypothetical protein
VPRPYATEIRGGRVVPRPLYLRLKLMCPSLCRCVVASLRETGFRFAPPGLHIRQTVSPIGPSRQVMACRTNTVDKLPLTVKALFIAAGIAVLLTRVVTPVPVQVFKRWLKRYP